MKKKTFNLAFAIMVFVVMIVYGFAMFYLGANKTIKEMKVNVDGNKVIVDVYGEEYIHEIEAE